MSNPLYTLNIQFYLSSVHSVKLGEEINEKHNKFLK